VGADVPVLAPVAGEGAVHAGQAAAERAKRTALGQRRGRVHRGSSRDASAGQPPWVIPYLWVGRTPLCGARAVHWQAGRGDACTPRTPRLCPQQSEGKRPFWHHRACVPTGGATLPPLLGKPALPTLMLGGPSSRLWELYLGSLKGDFSKRQQNKCCAPWRNKGERVRLTQAHREENYNWRKVGSD